MEKQLQVWAQQTDRHLPKIAENYYLKFEIIEIDFFNSFIFNKLQMHCAFQICLM